MTTLLRRRRYYEPRREPVDRIIAAMLWLELVLALLFVAVVYVGIRYG